MSGNPQLADAVSSIRHFNRYYTNRLGLLSRYRFDTRLTLTEARVTLEIGRRGEHTQSGLHSDLKIDGGYLNRVVNALVEAGLVQTRKDGTDRRVRVLSLTPKGRSTLRDIEAASNKEAESLMAGLTADDSRSVVEHLRAVERIWEGRAGTLPQVHSAESGRDIATVRVLIREYSEFLGMDLSFQHFEEELEGLPGKFGPPSGALFLATISRATGGSEPAGCVAVRRIGKGVCEMKRLFVRPEYRGFGVGRALAERAVSAGTGLGYTRMRLDTLERLHGAVALYKSMGFRRIEPYYHNPLPGATFWEKKLTPVAAGKRKSPGVTG